MWHRFCLAWLSLSAVSFATERMPWLGNIYELEGRASLFYQNYRFVESSKGDIHHSSNDFFLTLSGGVVPCEQTAVEVEMTGACTRHQHINVDNFRLTGRYNLLDDIAGDFITLTAGVTLTKAFRHSVHDFSSFHHGQWEGEIFLSIGNEEACGEDWVARFWTVAGIGKADVGSPWVRADAAYEYITCPHHLIRFFANSLWGLGKEDISPKKHFKGYGPINHRSVDVGLRYTYVIDFCGEVSLEYFYRVYAKNFPEHVNGVILSYYFPFGL
jgi:hypothetical protein